MRTPMSSVAEWLATLGLSEYADRFADNDIDTSVLHQLTEFEQILRRLDDARLRARHGTRQATRGTIINYASIPLIFMGGWTGYAIRQGAGLAIPLGFLTFSRGFEKEADFLGLQYLYKSGYDPTAFVDFFEKIQSMEKKKPGSISKVSDSTQSMLTLTRLATPPWARASIRDL